MRSRGEKGFTEADGKVAADRDAYIELGNVLIEKFISQ
jgi:hypothetical protein